MAPTVGGGGGGEPRHRDIGAFDERAAAYEEGWRGRLHHDIVDRVLDIALALDPAPARVLDVGCGTGYLLRRLAQRLPEAVSLEGVDPAPAMVAAATAAGADPRL
ncbi:MAG TPA: methyltransferase domain-containing protein, partial [Acidimicrobiales bacterium]|nr:methyltransferase domain-containing protein [Acidimicrobiales bacterium]